MNINPLGLIFLEPEETLKRALWTARHRDLGHQASFDALQLAATVVSTANPMQGAMALVKLVEEDPQAGDDAKLAMRLGGLRASYVNAALSIALRDAPQYFASKDDNGWVVAFNQAMGDELEPMLAHARDGLLDLIRGNTLPIMEAVANEHDREAPEDRALAQHLGNQIVTNALAMVIAFIRSGHFYETLRAQILASKDLNRFNPDLDGLMESLLTHVEPFVCLEPLLVRGSGDFTTPGDDGMPNLLLEGWRATHARDPSRAVLALALKKDRSASLACIGVCLESDGYPCNPGQTFTPGDFDTVGLPPWQDSVFRESAPRERRGGAETPSDEELLERMGA